MKTMKFALLTMCSMFMMSSAWAGSYVIEDDIYYNPDEKNPVVAKKEEEAKQKEAQKKLVMTADNTLRDVDEYNRRGSNAPKTSLNDLVANQTEEVVTYNIVDENGSDGYYLNGFNGSQSDYEYATRIRRFHNPKFVISISDPYYSDIYFLDNNDWNVYIDNNYAWVTPTWTNPWYWNYTWSPVSYTSWSWRWNFGPFGFSVGYRPYTPYYAWGANWGWNSWYHPYYHHHDYPYYAWNNPYRPTKPNYQYTPNGRTPNRNGGSYISSGGTNTTGNGRRSVIGNSSSTGGKNTTVSNGRRSTTSVSSGEGKTGVRTNRGTIINGNSSNSGRSNGYHFESTTSGSRRGSSSQSETIKTPSNNSGRQTTIGTNGRSSNRSNSYNSGSSNRSNSYNNNNRTTTPNRSSGYSSGSSMGRRPAGSSYSSPSRGSSSSSSGSSSRGSGSSGRSSGRR